MTGSISRDGVDLRSTLAPIRDQGQRPTCVAFAVTAAHEAFRSDPSLIDDLSEEALYWGCKCTDGNEISGTYFSSAAIAIGRWGQPLETEWPYEPLRPLGIAYVPPTQAGGKGWYKSALRKISVLPNEIHKCIEDGVPVVLGLRIFDTFFHPDSAGHISNPQPGVRHHGLHAVLVVGFLESELLIRNSWGITWALGGYAWISDTYLRDHASEAWVIDDVASLID